MRFSKTTLKNGLRVITVPMADNPSVTILVMAEAGSKYETKRENGISHFLEHMVFKGTPKRPNASDISHELDSIGAAYNAFTTQEFTGYYAKAAGRHLDTILDIVSDMYMNPLFDEKEIRKETGVITEEIRMYRDLPQRHVHDVMSELLFGDQPAGWNVAGTEENIKTFKRSDFVEYRKDHYLAESTIVLVAGSFDEAKIMKKIEKAFADVLTGKKKAKLPVKQAQKAPQIKTEFKETDQTHLVISMRTFPVNDKRLPAMQALATVLGGGMSSRLFAKLRDELGICYYVNGSNNVFTDHGDYSISAGLDNSRVEEGVKVILQILRDIKEKGVTEAELKKAKDYIAGTTVLELETSESRAEYCGFQEVLKKHIDLPEAEIEKINRVTVAEVKKLANEIFVNEGLNMAIVGRFKDGKGFEPYFKF